MSKQRQKMQTRNPSLCILARIAEVILQAKTPSRFSWDSLLSPMICAASTPRYFFPEKMRVHILCSPVLHLPTQRMRLWLHTGFFSSSAGCGSSRLLFSLPGASYPTLVDWHRHFCNHPNQTEGVIQVKNNTPSSLVYLRGSNKLRVQSLVGTT